MNEKDFIQVNLKSYKSTVDGMMNNLLTTGNSSDVTLVCDEKIKLKVHKFILNAYSPVLKDILEDSVDHQKSFIYLKGMKEKELIPILEFMYQGQVKIRKNLVDDFLRVAKDLQIKDLHKLSELYKGENQSKKPTEVNHVNQDLIQDYETNYMSQLEPISLEEDVQKSVIEPEEPKPPILYPQVSANKFLYKCPVCELLLDSTIKLNRHFTENHKNNLRSVKEVPIVYDCSMSTSCQFKTSSKTNLAKHLAIDHGNPWGELKFSDDKAAENHRATSKEREKKVMEKRILKNQKENYSNYNNSFLDPENEKLLKKPEEIDRKNQKIQLSNNRYLDIDLEYENFLQEPKDKQSNSLIKAASSDLQDEELLPEPKDQMIPKSATSKGFEYACDECDDNFENEELLIEHLELVHDEDVALYPCDNCDYFAETSEKLQIHINTDHAKSKKLKTEYMCPECDYTTNDKADIKNHLLQEHSNNVYFCKECKMEFQLKSNLDKHIEQIHISEGVRKNKVIKQNTSEVKLFNAQEIKSVFPCTKCGYNAPSKIHLKIHNESDHQGIKYPCTECDFESNQRFDLASHMKTNH